MDDKLILAVSYDGPPSRGEDYSGFVFRLFERDSGRFYVSLLPPSREMAEDSIFSLGEIDGERLSNVIERSAWAEEASWDLPKNFEEEVRNILRYAVLPLQEEDALMSPTWHTKVLITLYAGTLKRQYLFNMGAHEGFTPLVRISELIRCGRGGNLMSVCDNEGNEYSDEDEFVKGLITKINDEIADVYKGKLWLNKRGVSGKTDESSQWLLFTVLMRDRDAHVLESWIAGRISFDTMFNYVDEKLKILDEMPDACMMDDCWQDLLRATGYKD